MYAVDKNFAAPHTGIVLGMSALIAPVVYFLASLFIATFSKLAAVISYVILPTKKLDAAPQANTAAPHVALITVPGNFVTGAFKSW